MSTTPKSESKFDWSAFDALTEEEIHAAALADPDAQPLTEERLAKMRLVPRTKTLRRALGLSQEEFATRFHIPAGTLRDWEQGRSEPDAAARAYLRVIAREPEVVRRVGAVTAAGLALAIIPCAQGRDRRSKAGCPQPSIEQRGCGRTGLYELAAALQSRRRVLP